MKSIKSQFTTIQKGMLEKKMLFLKRENQVIPFIQQLFKLAFFTHLHDGN